MIPQAVVDWVVRIGVVTSVTAGLVFMVTYHLTSKWWMSSIGRHMMSFMSGMTLILLLSVVALIFPDMPFRQELRIFSWILIPGLFVWRAVVILKIRNYDDRGNHKK